MVRKSVFSAMVLAGLLLAACSSGIATKDVQMGGIMPPPDPVRLEAAGPKTSYRIGPFDVLDISVYQVPDLTKVVQVDATGQIVMPLIGQINAAGKTVAELQDELVVMLRAKYLQSPEVTVYVKEFASQKVTIDGSVMVPGVYPIQGKTTLLQALTLARGPDRMANNKHVVIFRMVNSQRMAAMFDINAIRAGTMSDPEVYGNDVIVVERSGVRALMRDASGALPLLGIFRPFIP